MFDEQHVSNLEPDKRLLLLGHLGNLSGRGEWL
jgi:hypothetical protein